MCAGSTSPCPCLPASQGAPGCLSARGRAALEEGRGGEEREKEERGGKVEERGGKGERRRRGKRSSNFFDRK